MVRRFAILILLLISIVAIYIFSLPIIDYFLMPKPLMMPAPPPVIGVEAGPLKVVITDETPWSSIAKLLVTVLGTFLGIRLINKYIK